MSQSWTAEILVPYPLSGGVRRIRNWRLTRRLRRYLIVQCHNIIATLALLIEVVTNRLTGMPKHPGRSLHAMITARFIWWTPLRGTTALPVLGKELVVRSLTSCCFSLRVVVRRFASGTS
jgi:hypothetical protein